MVTGEMAKQIFLEGIKGVLPGKLIKDMIALRGSILKIGYLSYDLNMIDRLFVLGAGKASAALAHYLESITGSRITRGYIVTKYGHSCRLKYIEVEEAGHPVPDSNSFKASGEISAPRVSMLCNSRFSIAGFSEIILASVPLRSMFGTSYQ